MSTQYHRIATAPCTFCQRVVELVRRSTDAAVLTSRHLAQMGHGFCLASHELSARSS